MSVTLTPEILARRFHEAYERLAPLFGYETRRESAVAWEEVPARNRDLMVAVCAELIAGILHATLTAQVAAEEGNAQVQASLARAQEDGAVIQSIREAAERLNRTVIVMPDEAERPRRWWRP